MALHLIFSPAGYAACAAVKEDSDQILLLGDGVYQLPTADEALYFLQEDAEQRGLHELPAQHRGINYDQMVELITQNHPVASWQR